MLAGDAADSRLWKRYDWEFHHALMSACGSQGLLDAHAAVYDKYLRYQMIAVIFRGETPRANTGNCSNARSSATRRRRKAILIKHIQDCVTYTLDRAPAHVFGGEPMRRRRASALMTASV